MVQDGWDDEALWRGLRAQNTRAMEALVARYSRELTYFVRSLLGGVATAQDVEECVSDVFVVAWKEAGDFDPARGTFRTWLTMRAKYLALDTRRQVQRRQALLLPPTKASEDDHDHHALGHAGASGEHAEGRAGTLDPAESVDGLLERRERQAELRAALEELPELDRLLVYLRYFKLATTEEIAVRTGLTHRAIDTRLWRSRKQLRDVLEKLEERAKRQSRERSKQLQRTTLN